MTTLEEEKHQDTSTSPSSSPSLVDDTIQYIKTHQLEIILLLLGILFILYPQAVPGKYVQRGGNEEAHGAPPPPANNPVIDKVRGGIERIGSGIMRAFSVIASIFLIFGLISLPFIIYAIVFYFVVKRGFAAASTL